MKLWKTFRNDLYNTYVDTHIKKEKNKKEISFQLKPLIYELHGIYLKDHKKITIHKVDEFILNLKVERLTFILGYYQ